VDQPTADPVSAGASTTESSLSAEPWDGSAEASTFAPLLPPEPSSSTGLDPLLSSSSALTSASSPTDPLNPAAPRLI
ncbi:MAG: hypothetical protein ACO4AJ_13780, partial [Prochlorothrix sp.]